MKYANYRFWQLNSIVFIAVGIVTISHEPEHPFVLLGLTVFHGCLLGAWTVALYFRQREDSEDEST